VKLIGILLIVFGVVALAVGGITYTSREKVLDIGPLKATADRQRTIPLSPIAGIVAIAAGAALVAVGSKRTV
jgi:drug/metabolite transporter (DMT)-like permease